MAPLEKLIREAATPEEQNRLIYEKQEQLLLAGELRRVARGVDAEGDHLSEQWQRDNLAAWAKRIARLADILETGDRYL